MRAHPHGHPSAVALAELVANVAAAAALMLQLPHDRMVRRSCCHV